MDKFISPLNLIPFLDKKNIQVISHKIFHDSLILDVNFTGWTALHRLEELPEWLCWQIFQSFNRVYSGNSGGVGIIIWANYFLLVHICHHTQIAIIIKEQSCLDNILSISLESRWPIVEILFSPFLREHLKSNKLFLLSNTNSKPDWHLVIAIPFINDIKTHT